MSRFLLHIPKYILGLTLSVLNLLSVLALNVSAYASWLPPQSHPSASYVGLLFPIFLVATLAFLPVWLLLGVMGLHFGSSKKKRRSAYWGMFFSLGGMLLCAGSIRTYYPLNWRTEAPDSALTILSYNIFSLHNPDKLPVDEHPTVRYILDSNADIVCMQEASGWQKQVSDSLVEAAFPYRSHDKSHGSNFTLLSRLPILSSDTIPLISKSNGAVCYQLQMPRGDTLLLINCHLESYKLKPAEREEYEDLITNPDTSKVREYVGPLTRKLTDATVIRGPQVDSIAAFIERQPHRYIILCGDLNDSPISYTHHRLTRLLDDAYTRSGIGPGFSYNQSGMYFRIDHILCSPAFRSYEAQVDAGIKTSDHYPIRCRLLP